jgi:hypothetical protein
MNAKKAVLALVVVLLAFWMFTDPDGLATAAGAAAGKAWQLGQQLLTAIVDFVGALT